MAAVNYRHVSTVSSGLFAPAGAHALLVSVNVNTGATSAVLDIYDGTSTSGVKIASIDATVARSFWFGGVRANGGLFFNLSGGAADVTISFI